MALLLRNWRLELEGPTKSRHFGIQLQDNTRTFQAILCSGKGVARQNTQTKTKELQAQMREKRGGKGILLALDILPFLPW